MTGPPSTWPVFVGRETVTRIYLLAVSRVLSECVSVHAVLCRGNYTQGMEVGKPVVLV